MWTRGKVGSGACGMVLIAVGALIIHNIEAIFGIGFLCWMAYAFITTAIEVTKELLTK